MAVVGPVFLDTSVLIAGLIELRPPPNPAQALLSAVAEGELASVCTAWHCCLEFFAVTTRLPEPYRLSPRDSLLLLDEEILTRFVVHDLAGDQHRQFLRQAVGSGKVSGGGIYDAHIAEVAEQAGARTVVTENLRHFASLQDRGVLVVDSQGLVDQLAAP